ncbi:hypothetical protein CLOACE_22540 [Clostridium acetireducens DSM 10703]|uniref:Uncharacterized protein n=1 Tax=Clostridium acetireducens DSM 10703 TaxID=1121290 RepID=A0A1E8EV51_9CLOT|nr:hypothetical protein [Clostridium acetireducens]OFH99384.1 hypothetical protein CLOACE_22540 [Clostridium acetireducens DSM 10703]
MKKYKDLKIKYKLLLNVFIVLFILICSETFVIKNFKKLHYKNKNIHDTNLLSIY